MLAWHLRQYGWDFEILTPSIALQPQAWIDPDGERFFAPHVVVTEAAPVQFSNLLKRIGIRGLSWQGLFPIYRAGSKILRKGEFDLVFFSTTAFNFFCIGRLWQRRFGVPYAVDLQDPWYRVTPAKVETTKYLRKAKIGNVLSRFMERYAVQTADGIISVSPDYLHTMEARYPNTNALREGRMATIPFGAEERDFRHLPKNDRPDIPLTIAYVGTGGLLMAKSFGRFARALARLRSRHPELIELFRVRLIGTDPAWSEGRPKILKDIADASGIADLVAEEPAIVPYSKATKIANAAHGLLVLGVDEDAYMASKLFSYASLQKPLIACLAKKSQMNSYFEKYPNLGTVIHFDDSEDSEGEDTKVLEFLEQIRGGHKPDRSVVMADHSAMAMTRKIAELFDRCVGLSES
jgi:hypothetical protein